MMISPTGKGLRSDIAGDGAFRSKRGSKLHRGMDFLCDPGQDVVSPISGIAIRLARPYADDSIYSGIVLGNSMIQVKMFYLVPKAKILGTRVSRGDIIGIAQDISAKYGKHSGMLPHIHVEVRLAPGLALLSSGDILVDPELFMQEV